MALDQQDSSLKRWSKTVLLNGAVIFSLYALGFGLYPQFAFVFETVRVAYTILLSIAVFLLLIGGLALAFTNSRLNKIINNRALRKLYLKDGELTGSANPNFDAEKVLELGSKLRGPLRWANLGAAFVIMALAFNIGAYYLMVIELLSEVFLSYFVESGRTTHEYIQKLNKLAVKDSLQE